jgi:hypothetical protein
MNGLVVLATSGCCPAAPRTGRHATLADRRASEAEGGSVLLHEPGGCGHDYEGAATCRRLSSDLSNAAAEADGLAEAQEGLARRAP